MTYVFQFDHAHRLPDAELRQLLGGKGAGLHEMITALHLPVPPGFTVSTAACRHVGSGRVPAALTAQIEQNLAQVEERVGRRYGDPDNPLLVSVRSGAAESMPGMLDTVLNVGLNLDTTAGLAAVTGDAAFAADSYRRFLLAYATVVLAVPADALADRATGSEWDDEAMVAPFTAIEALQSRIEELSGLRVPDDPREQLLRAVEAVFRSWESPRARSYRQRARIDGNLGTAVSVQAMVFGNLDEMSGTGVVFTRDPNTGEPTPFGDFLSRAQGEDVVNGGSRTEDIAALGRRFPEVKSELDAILGVLEARFRDMCDVEFTVEHGRLWILQTRVGKRSVRAGLRIAVDLASGEPPLISRAEAVERISSDGLAQLAQEQVADSGTTERARGLGASPGVATGHVYFDADRCADAADRGEPVLLVRRDTSPEDVHAMQVAEGILTARGGMVSHAAVVARGWGIPAVVGVEDLRFDADDVLLAGRAIVEGEVLTINGTDGVVLDGAAPVSAQVLPDELATVAQWALDVVGADRSGPTSAHARAIAEAVARLLGGVGGVPARVI